MENKTLTKLYEEDGDPEESFFTNKQGYKLHTYIWYPDECKKAIQKSITKSLFYPASNSNASSVPPFSMRSLSSDILKNVKGIVILLHGYESHARFSWFSKPTPPDYKFQDPTVSALLQEKYLQNISPFTSQVSPTLSSSGSFSSEIRQKTELNKWCLRFKGSWIEKLTRENYIVAAYDFQSHGLSEGYGGKRCAIEKLDNLAIDSLHFLYQVNEKFNEKDRYLEEDIQSSENKELNDEGSKSDEKTEKHCDKSPIKKLPIFMCGSSLGGWTIARMLQLAYKYPPSVFSSCLTSPFPIFSISSPSEANLKGVILIAPMFSLCELKKSIRYSFTKPFINLLGNVFPFIYLSSKKANELHPHMEKYFINDPLTHKGGARACCVKEMLHATDIIHNEENMKEIKEAFCPTILCIHNFLDTLCEIEGCFRFFNNINISNNNKTFVAVNVKMRDNFIIQHFEKENVYSKTEEKLTHVDKLDDEKQDNKGAKEKKQEEREMNKVQKIEKGLKEDEVQDAEKKQKKRNEKDIDIGKEGETDKKEYIEQMRTETKDTIEEKPENSNKEIKNNKINNKELISGMNTDKYKIYYNENLKNEDLRLRLLQYANEEYQGLDVFHSLATEPHNFIIFQKVLEWLSMRQNN